MRKRGTSGRHNPMARAVRGPTFRLRVTRNKRRYRRKAKHRRHDPADDKGDGPGG